MSDTSEYSLDDLDMDMEDSQASDTTEILANDKSFSDIEHVEDEETSHIQNYSISKFNHYPRKFLQGLNQLRTRGDFCDITIIVGKKHIDAHRLVLSICSPYFQAMFTSNLKESKEHNVTLHDLNEKAVEIIIDSAYTAQIIIDDSNVQDILAAATLLQMQEIQTRCCNYIKKQMSPANCLGIKAIADKYSCQQLFDSAEALILECFKEVVKSEEFLRLEPDQLVEIISSDSLEVSSEEQVYEALVQWVNYNNIPSDNNRSSYLPDLLKHVRFSQMNHNYLINLSNIPVINVHQRCRQYVEEAKKYLSLNSMCKENNTLNSETSMAEISLCDPRFKPRSRKKLYAVGGCINLNFEPISTVERYDPNTDKWTLAAEMNEVRGEHCVAVLNNLIYAIGGYDNKVVLRTIERYHRGNNRWTTDVAPLKSRRSGANVVTLNGFLYVIGGKCASVDKYNPFTNSWSECAPMKHRRDHAGVVVVDKHIYAIGGADKNGESRTSVERYSSHLDLWQPMAPMITGRVSFGCTAYNGHIYAVGGYDSPKRLNTAERYNTRKNLWETIPPINQQREGFALVEMNGLLYAVGGINGSTTLKSVEVYDPVKEMWSPRASMSHARFNLRMAVLA